MLPMAPDGERGKFLQRTPATWLDGQNVFTFSTLPPGSRSLDIWTFAGSATAHVRKREISEESVKNWLRESAPERNGQTPTAGLRLIEVTSADCKGAIPSSKETLEQLFDRWGLPCLETPWIPLYAGGSSLSIAESRDGTRVNFLLGGTRYKRAIGGVFSYHCQSNVTSGIVISGSDLSPWIVELPTLFLRLPHPMTIVVAMGEALMETVLTLKARYRARVKQIEGMSQRAIETNSPLQDHRLLAIELGLLNWLNAKSKIGFERSHAQFKFALQHLQSPDGPFSHETCRSKLEAACQTLLSRTSFSLASLETLGLEHDSNQSRFETQRLIVSNLIAQQDVNLSVTMAKDSNVIAAASRRDSSVMRIIAILGMVFLPATFTAVRHLEAQFYFTRIVCAREIRRTDISPDVFHDPPSVQLGLRF